MKKQTSFTLLMIALLLTGQAARVKAQPSASSISEFRMTIENVKQINDRTLEFDLFILDADKGHPFELALVQAGIMVNPAFYEGGVMTANLVEGRSQLVDAQQPQNVLFAKEGSIIKLPSRTLRPLQKDSAPERRGTLISEKAPGTRVCSIRLTNTQPFTKAPVNLAFNFAKQPYPTSVSQYIDGVNTPLSCNESNCSVK